MKESIRKIIDSWLPEERRVLERVPQELLREIRLSSPEDFHATIQEVNRRLEEQGRPPLGDEEREDAEQYNYLHNL